MSVRLTALFRKFEINVNDNHNANRINNLLRLKSKLKTVKVNVMVKVVLKALWQFCGDREEPVMLIDEQFLNMVSAQEKE